MEIDVRVELKQREHVSLCDVIRLRPEHERIDRASLLIVGALRNGREFEIGEKPARIDAATLNAGHHAIPLHIVEAIGIKLARHNGIVKL